MNDPHDDHPGASDSEDGSVISMQQMAVGRAEEFVLRNKGAALGTAFQGTDLLFQAQDKSGGRIGIVLGDIIPYGGCISLSGGSDVNPVFFWHV